MNVLPFGRRSLMELPDRATELDSIIHLFLNPQFPIKKLPLEGWRTLVQVTGTGYDGEWQLFAIEKSGLTYRYYMEGCEQLPCQNGKVLEMLDRMGYILPAMQQKQARNYRKYVSSNK